MRRAAQHYQKAQIVSPTNGKIGCNGKRCYANKAVAENQANRTRNGTGDRFSAYRCRHCSWWHVGAETWPRMGKKPRIEVVDGE